LDTIFIERMPQKAFDARHDHELTLMVKKLTNKHE